MLSTLKIPGYNITEVVHEGLMTVIYRCISQAQGQSFILKCLLAEHPSLECVTRLKYEYQIQLLLNHPNVVKAINYLSFSDIHRRQGLLLEDFGGQSLAQLLQTKKLDVIDCLSVAIQVAKALDYLHKNQIVHKDIKPSNIIVNDSTGIVKLTDFSIASKLNKENPQFCNPNAIEGTLAYMSPEQTGRMNRNLDYRTDFYSLGITLYEMLTLELPFQSNDPLEIIYNHIAKEPIPPNKINPDIPAPVSEIVMKLMAKNAEDRYQSAAGLLADLEICQEKLKNGCEINNFIPGRSDYLSQLVIPQKLYGREPEVAELLAAVERVTQGSKELVLISGHSGIGKSALVNEVSKPITKARGYFISGKFDMLKREVPYAPLIQAFTSLIRLLLTENSEELEEWKRKINVALGTNAQVIIEIIPEVELIIGKQLPATQLAPTESQNRFLFVFQQFISIFCHLSHPLVIFLDDLQWADLATLKFIELLATDNNIKHLLIIGAYRDSEVNHNHLLVHTEEKIKQSNIKITNISLQSISFDSVCQLVADTLSDVAKQSYSLAEVIFNKTSGNPFFITQLLQILFQKNLLYFDVYKLIWEWNIKKIKAFSITDTNLIELIVSRIEKLPQTTQEILKLAACIGNKFTLHLLSAINHTFPSQTANYLNLALQEGLIIPLNGMYQTPALLDDLSASKEVSYAFIHDRVQQAAYCLISDEQKQATHLKIGKTLKISTPQDKLLDKILDIVNQLNLSIDLITYQSEKNDLASYNLTAGRKAKNSAAFQIASNYFNVGLKLLPLDCWQSNYDITLDLYLEIAEAEYLNGNFNKSNELANIVLKQAKTILDKVKAYTITIQAYMAQNQVMDALGEGTKALRLLGIKLPLQPTNLHCATALLKMKLALLGKRVEDLVKLPQMNDPYILAATQILMLILPSANMAGSKLFPLALFTIINLSIKYGNCAASSYAYTVYGAMLCTSGNIDVGYSFACAGLNILNLINVNSLKCKVHNLFYTMIWHFKNPVQSMTEPTFLTIQTGLEIGDIEFAGYSALSLSSNLLFSDESLDNVIQQSSQFIQLLKNFQLEALAGIINNILETSKALQLPYACLEELKQNYEKQLVIVGKNKILISFIDTNLTLYNYFFFNYQEAIKCAKSVEKLQKGNPGFFIYQVNNFYYSLSLLGHFKNASFFDQLLYLKKIATNQNKMKLWAHHAECNFQNKYDLVEAEKARVLGRYMKAMDLYDKAIIGAAKNGYIQELALANELAAKFYLELGKTNIAKTYMSEARYHYACWGASSKVKDLEEHYPNLVTRSPQQTLENTALSTNSTTYGKSLSMDMLTIVKASQALSSEIILERLLEKLMHLLKENAGAQKVLFIAKKDAQLVVEASLIEQINVTVLQSVPITKQEVPLSLIAYVERTQAPLVLDDATKTDNFKNDPYITINKPKSVLVYPVIYSGQLIGILYLENNLTTNAFTQERLEVLQILSIQAAISLENASFYSTLEVRVKDRTQELEEKNQELQAAFKQLRLTQAQLIQNEKMSSLGQLVAGIAHEINNPINFIYGNLSHISQYAQSLLELIHIFEEEYPNPKTKIVDKINEIDIDFVKDDIPNLLSSMQSGASRIRDIVQSLRNFSRLDEAAIKEVDIHEGIESSIMILKHRLETIEVIKDYGSLPVVKCYANQLNQVFLHLLTNAIDALLEHDFRSLKSINEKPTILIRTLVDEKNQVMISITDNGVGMDDELKNKIFDPFFTTKPVGRGTGLGLSISHEIIIEKHKGILECVSSPKKGTTFIIKIPQKII